MKASIIVFCKNQKDTISQIIPSLLSQEYDKSEYEIIVIDSGSSDGSVEYIRSQPVQFLQVKSEEFQYARTFNFGASKSRGEILIKLSGDAVPVNNHWLAALLDPFADPNIGATFGKYTIGTGRKGYGYPQYWPARRFPKQLTRYHTKRLHMFSGLNVFDNQKVFLLAGGCCAFRRSIWEYRHMNESIPKGEDAEWSWFIHLLGYDIVYTPEAIVLHEHKIQHFYVIRDWKVQIYIHKAIYGYWLKKLIFRKDPYKAFGIITSQ